MTPLPPVTSMERIQPAAGIRRVDTPRITIK